MRRRQFILLIHAPLEASFRAVCAAHWPPLLEAARAGCRYARRERGVVRHGRLIDCQRPVMLVLRELLAVPWPVLRAHYRYRLEPAAAGGRTRLMLEIRLQLFVSGRLTPWWRLARVEDDDRRRLSQIRSAAEAASSQARAVAGDVKIYP